ncbi:MAG: hypothetical protein IT176_00490 [Acidobacteria bacterium]|nr:hypothetical protein [Acidobacteriota bacterium]
MIRSKESGSNGPGVAARAGRWAAGREIKRPNLAVSDVRAARGGETTIQFVDIALGGASG